MTKKQKTKAPVQPQLTEAQKRMRIFDGELNKLCAQHNVRLRIQWSQNGPYIAIESLPENKPV